MRFTRRSFLAISSSLAAGLALPQSSAAITGLSGIDSPPRVLDPQTQLQQFTFWQNRDWPWYESNIPFFESPEPQIDRVYYYRWELITRHLQYTCPQYGYIATEFLKSPEVTWAGRYQGISGAADLHLDDLRWMRDGTPARDYLRYFLTVPGAKPRAYGFAPCWAGNSMAAVHGGANSIADLFPQCVANYEAWQTGRVAYPNDNGFSASEGLFWNTGRDMGSEMNLASAQLSEHFKGIVGYKIRGGAGFRPDINAVLFAEAQAIAELASAQGDIALARNYQAKAAVLKANVQAKLWDPQREFFLHRWRYDEYADGDEAGVPSIRANSLIWQTNRFRQGGVGFDPAKQGQGHGREIFAYHLWRYALPDDNPEDSPVDGYARAWKFLTSAEYFAGSFGPRTGEIQDPWYSVIYGECRHNGQTWPYHTARILAAGLVLLNEYKHHQFFDEANWMRLFRQYAAMHELAGRPFIAESHDPDRPQWTELRPIGYHYFHSSFIDHVITGVVGLRPSKWQTLEVNPLCPPDWDYFALDNVLYHGFNIQVLWDRTGNKYHRGRGLQILANGIVLAQRERLGRLSARLPGEAVMAQAIVRQVNYATNAERLPFPKAVASYTNPVETVDLPIDGSRWYDAVPVHRWTSRGSPDESHWYEVQFEQPCRIQRVVACFYEDDVGIEAPQQISLAVWTDGAWKVVYSTDRAAVILPRCATDLRFVSVMTDRVRLQMVARPCSGVGLAAFEAWG